MPSGMLPNRLGIYISTLSGWSTVAERPAADIRWLQKSSFEGPLSRGYEPIC